MKTQLETIVEKINEEHFRQDYGRSVLNDRTLIRNLRDRAKAAGIDMSKLVLGEYGPCGSFAYRVKPVETVEIAKSEHAALVAVAEAAKKQTTTCALLTSKEEAEYRSDASNELNKALANLAAVRNSNK